jgi:hypothetical protein
MVKNQGNDHAVEGEEDGTYNQIKLTAVLI